MEFAYAGGGLGKGGVASLYVDGKKVGEGKVAATAAMVFSADDGCDVGVDTGSPVSPDYGPRGNEFSGRVKGVQLAIAEDAESVDHLVSAGGSRPHRHGAAVSPVTPVPAAPIAASTGSIAGHLHLFRPKRCKPARNSLSGPLR